MKIFLAFLLCSLYLQDLQDVSLDNLDQFSSSTSKQLLFLYAKDSGDCSMILKWLPELVQKYKESISFGILEVTENPTYESVFGDVSVPYFIYYDHQFSTPIPFAPTKTRLDSWLNTNLNKKTRQLPLKNKQHLERLKQQDKGFVFYFNENNHQFKEIFEALTKVYPRYKFYVPEKQIENAIFDSSKGTFQILFFGNDIDLKFSDEPFTPKELQNYVEEMMNPVLKMFDQSAIDQMFNPQFKSVIIFDHDVNSSFVQNVKQMAYKYQKNLLFIFSNMQEDKIEPLYRQLGVKEIDMPVVRAVDLIPAKKQFKKFKPEGNSLPEIEEFLNKLSKNMVIPYIKSQPIPKSQHKVIKQIVKDNFEEIVMDPTKDVIVAFKTDWCSHCKEIDSCFNDIKRELYSTVNDLIFGTVDFDENDLDIEITSFPTILLYKKNDKQNPIKYEGMRDYEVLLNWIEEQIPDQRLYQKKMPEDLIKQQQDIEEKMKSQGYKTVNPSDYQEEDDVILEDL